MNVELQSLLSGWESFRERFVPFFPESSQNFNGPSQPFAPERIDEVPLENAPYHISESALMRLLEQLLHSSERNADTVEKIAELLGSGDNVTSPVYN